MDFSKILKWVVSGVFFVVFLVFALSGSTIKPGEEGFLFDSFGGGINKEIVYQEGYIPHLPWKEMIIYNIQYTSRGYESKVLDKDGTEITLMVKVNFAITKGKSPLVHLKHGIGYRESIVDVQSLGAIKDVVGKYGYEEIYGAKRDKLETEIETLVTNSLIKENIIVAFVEVTDVNLPPAIASAIVDKQTQEQINLKAEKIKAYEQNIADANTVAAKGRFDVAEFDNKTKTIMSQPKLIELYNAETERVWAEKGVSRFGSNNVFGTGSTTVIKGLK